MHHLDSSLGLVVLLEGNETVALALAGRLVDDHLVADDLAEGLEVLEELIVVPLLGHVLDEQVGEVLRRLVECDGRIRFYLGSIAELAHAVISALESSDKDLLVFHQHAVNLFNGSLGALVTFEVDESKALGSIGIADN